MALEDVVVARRPIQHTFDKRMPSRGQGRQQHPGETTSPHVVPFNQILQPSIPEVVVVLEKDAAGVSSCQHQTGKGSRERTNTLAENHNFF